MGQLNDLQELILSCKLRMQQHHCCHYTVTTVQRCTVLQQACTSAEHML